LTIAGQSLRGQPERGNSYGQIQFEWPQDQTADAVMALAHFPGIYQIRVNGNLFPQEKIVNNNGFVALEEVSLLAGVNTITWQIVQSPQEKIFNYISLAFLMVWLGILIGVSLSWPKKTKAKINLNIFL
jgi:hypothetical protein